MCLIDKVSLSSNSYDGTHFCILLLVRRSFHKQAGCKRGRAGHWILGQWRDSTRCQEVSPNMFGWRCHRRCLRLEWARDRSTSTQGHPRSRDLPGWSYPRHTRGSQRRTKRRRYRNLGLRTHIAVDHIRSNQANSSIRQKKDTILFPQCLSK